MIDLSHRKDILEDIKEEIEINWSYFIQLFFASIIAVLGLLINSTAVVIGAMLISPIFWPIIGLSIGIITTKDKELQKSAFMLGSSILITILLGYLITLVTPNAQVNNEILSRTNPTILDLFIALASATIGVLALFNKRIANSAAGVAISIALLPPLATSGVGIAFGDWNVFLRSFLLFSANALAIVVTGVITLYVLNFRPIRKDDKKRYKIGIAVSAISFLSIATLLSIFTISSINEGTTRQKIIDTLNSQVVEIHPDAEIEDIRITFPATDQPIDVRATLLLPEQVFLTLNKETELNQSIVDKTNQPVELKFNVLNTLLIRQDNQNAELIDSISKFTRSSILELNDKITIDRINTTVNDNDDVQVDAILRTSTENFLTIQNRDDIQNDLQRLTDKNVNLSIAFIPFQRLEDQSQEEILASQIRSTIETDLNLISTDIEIQTVRVTENPTTQVSIPNPSPQTQVDTETFDPTYTAEILLLAPEGTNISNAQKLALEQIISTQVNPNISLDIKTIFYNN